MSTQTAPPAPVAPIASHGPPTSASPGPATSAPATAATPESVGAVPLRPMSVGEILDGAMGLLRRYPGPTLGVGAFVTTAQVLLTVPALWVTANLTVGAFSSNGTSDSDVLGVLLGLTFSAALQSLVSTACGAVATGAAAVVVGDAALGRPVSIRTVWTQLRPRAGGLIGLALLLAVVFATVLATVSVAWVFLAGVLGLAVPAFVLERVGVFAAFRRSWQLSIGGFFRVLWIRVLARLVGLVLQQVLGSVLAILVLTVVTVGVTEEPGPWMLLLIVTLLTLGFTLPSVVVTPFLGCVDALLYADRRMRAEGLDVEMGLDRRARGARG